ncbi:hypothetical protein [uncultured Nostoc sp.]|uniref:hypothetical protein n=1 Tax=uncultured Nostoc sp. TaxID=340711 RepID=UPI0035CA8718
MQENAHLLDRTDPYAAPNSVYAITGTSVVEGGQVFPHQETLLLHIASWTLPNFETKHVLGATSLP